MTEDPSLLALWCVPRSRSTAFERAMHERGDLLVLHEPFSRVCDFGAVDIGGQTCTSQDEVMTTLVELATDRPVFFKDTTDFRIDRLGVNPEFVRRCRHAAMVRTPHDTVRSHLLVQADATSETMGFRHLWEIVSTVVALGLPMHLVDGDQLVGDPDGEMRLYCEAMGIAFVPESLAFRKEPPLSWEATGRWHTGASESKALGASPAREEGLSDELERIASAFERDQAPFYELIRKSLGGDGGGPGVDTTSDNTTRDKEPR